MLLEPSPDVYQISDRAQRYVAICSLSLFLTAVQVFTPSP
jgi:hypothetical protein